MTMTTPDRKAFLIRQSRTIWRILQETPGLTALATSLETDYDDLSKPKRVTIAMVIDAYEKARASSEGPEGEQPIPAETVESVAGEFVPPAKEPEAAEGPSVAEVIAGEVVEALTGG